MSLESDLFMKRKPDEKKLRSFGFVPENDGFSYERIVMDGKFRAVVRVSSKGDVSGDMIDAETDEEYLRSQGVKIRQKVFPPQVVNYFIQKYCIENDP